MALNPQFLLANNGVYGFEINGTILAGMPYPPNHKAFWQDLYTAGIQRVLCLTDDTALYDPAPVEILDARCLVDLDGEMIPPKPIEEQQKILGLVSLAHQSVVDGYSVVVHCKGGTGRTGTIMGAVLRKLGYSWDEVIEAMTQVNKLRGKYPKGWPDAIWQKELVKGWN